MIDLLYEGSFGAWLELFSSTCQSTDRMHMYLNMMPSIQCPRDWNFWLQLNCSTESSSKETGSFIWWFQFGTVPRLDSRQKLEEEQHPEVLSKRFWLQCPVFLKHPVSLFCVFSVSYSFWKTIVKSLCIWKACTHSLEMTHSAVWKILTPHVLNTFLHFLITSNKVIPREGFQSAGIRRNSKKYWLVKLRKYPVARTKGLLSAEHMCCNPPFLTL